MRRTIARRQILKSGLLAGAALSLPFIYRHHALAGPVDPAAVKKLGASLKGRLIAPGDTDYDSARLLWNPRFDKHPAMIVRCAGADDVVRSIEFSRANNLPAAVRSGGHGWPGYAGCDGGLVIDLSQLKWVTVDAKSLTADAGPGNSRNDLLAALGEHGCVTPMGACPDVGIGGLTLGGGEGDLIAKHGVACDALLAAEVVTADGRKLLASADENRDLFTGVRGGGGNFGVVTSLRYRLYRLDRVVAGVRTYTLSAARDVFRAYRDAVTKSPDELTSYAGSMTSNGSPVFAIFVCYCGDPKDADKVLAPLRSIGRSVTDTIRSMTYVDDNTPLPGGYLYQSTGVFCSELKDSVIDGFLSQLKNPPSYYQAFFVHYHGAVTRVPQHETAFPLRREGFSVFIVSGSRSQSDLAADKDWGDHLRNAIAPPETGVYVNDVGDEGEARVRDAYGANYDRLVALKTKYDPTNFFRLNQNIKPV